MESSCCEAQLSSRLADAEAAFVLAISQLSRETLSLPPRNLAFYFENIVGPTFGSCNEACTPYSELVYSLHIVSITP